MFEGLPVAAWVLVCALGAAGFALMAAQGVIRYRTWRLMQHDQ